MKRRIGVDFSPLRVSKQYRRLFLAGAVTSLGTQATYVTVPYQLKQLTHSPLQVGALGLAELLPLIVCGLYGGILADRMNRRTLIISMEASLMVVTGLILLNAVQPHPFVWVLYAAAFVSAAVASLQNPSVAALNQSLVPHRLPAWERPASASASAEPGSGPRRYSRWPDADRQGSRYR